jgi:hypothetical protein
VGKVSKIFEREIKESKKSRFFFEDSVLLGYQKEETVCYKNCEYVLEIFIEGGKSEGIYHAFK